MCSDLWDNLVTGALKNMDQKKLSSNQFHPNLGHVQTEEVAVVWFTLKIFIFSAIYFISHLSDPSVHTDLHFLFHEKGPDRSLDLPNLPPFN